MKIKRVKIDESQRKTLLESAGADSGLTLEGVNQIADFIETAVNSKVTEIAKALKTEAAAHFRARYRKVAEANVRRQTAGLVKKMDLYLDQVVNEWYQKNKPEIDTSIEAVRDRKIVEGVLGLFESSYFAIPAGKQDMVKELGSYAAKMERMATGARKKVSEASRKEEALRRRCIVEIAARKLTDTQREKLYEMAKNIRAKDTKDFTEKVKVARRTFSVTSESVSSAKKATLVTESKPVTKDVSDLISRASAIA